MNRWDPDKYLEAWNFASRAHAGQRVPGSDLPYINHVGSVAMETLLAIGSGPGVSDPDLLVQCALLHDVLEDTGCSYQGLAAAFGTPVADGVAALSKDPALATKRAQMEDSLRRIRSQPREIWMVKLADRITNLQPPPRHWSRERICAYGEESRLILAQLGAADAHLAARLARKIARYGAHARAG